MPYTKDQIAEAVEAFNRLGTLTAAAGELGVSRQTIKRRLDEAGDQTVTPSSVDELLMDRGLDPKEWVSDSVKIGEWGPAKDRKDSLTATFTRRTAPTGIFPATRREFIANSAPVDKDVTVIIPDSQIGYYREGSRLQPLHSEEALAHSVALVEAVRPYSCVLMGDMLDFPSVSSHRVTPEMQFLINNSIQRMYDYLVDLKAASPDTDFYYLFGNHEDRLRKYIIDKAPAIHGLRNGKGDNVLSLSRLLHLDELDVECVEEYGESLWLRGINFHHGEVAKSGSGSTVTALAKEAYYDEVIGHIHKIEGVTKTVFTPEGRKEISVWSFGCLCRVDGAVPAYKKNNNWQQGLGIVTHTTNGNVFEPIRIIDDKMYYRGVVYSVS